MYSGEAVETGSIEDVFDKMRHPIHRHYFVRFPFLVPIKTKAHLWQFPVIFHYLMSALMGVILALDVTILKQVDVTPAK
jgi:ABC-type oligopeptide transport system ATPase subunit